MNGIFIGVFDQEIMENGYRWDEEFQEEDMWGVVVKEREDSDSDCGRRSRNTKRRNRAKSSKNVQESRMSSAPVNIPDWSKIYGTNPKKWEVDKDSSWDGDDGDDVNVMMPPHQVIARKQLSSFSVFEGAGRTLKGRDLSRVRNAVLTKTGFLESKSHHY